MVNNGKHIPWFVKQPNSFGGKKFALLCRIAKQLFGTNIMVKVALNGYNVMIPKAKEFNNRGYGQMSLLKILKQFYPLGKDPIVLAFFRKVNDHRFYYPDYYYNQEELREKMTIVKCQKLYRKYDELMSWFDMMKMSKKKLKHLIDTFRSEMITSIT